MSLFMVPVDTIVRDTTFQSRSSTSSLAWPYSFLQYLLQCVTYNNHSLFNYHDLKTFIFTITSKLPSFTTEGKYKFINQQVTSKLPFIKIQIIGSYDKLSLTGSYYLRVQSQSYCGGMYKTMLQTQPSYKGLVSENLLIMRQGERISGLEDKVKEMVSTVQKCKI